MIRGRMKQAQDNQKSHANQKRHDLKFQVGDKVFVIIASYRHVIRFNRKSNLAQRFIGTFKVLQRVSKVAYRLALLANMYYIHNVFHVLLLCKYISDLTNVLNVRDVELKDDLVYKECLIQIFDK